MNGGNRVDKHFAYKILKEGLLDEHQIKIEDEHIFNVLEAASDGDKGALKYLENAPEIQQLLEALQGVNDTYTVRNLDKIQSYLKNNPEYNDKFYIRFDDFYVEKFDEMLRHLMRYLFDLQSMDQIAHFVKLVSKRMPELKKIGFPENYNELTFVVKVSFDAEDGALVHQVLMGKTQDIDVEQLGVDLHEDGDDEDSEDFEPNQEPFATDQFISIWSKRTYDKHIALIMLKSLSYGDSLFSMFKLDEEQVKGIKK